MNKQPAKGTTRREWFLGLGAGGLASLTTGCAGARLGAEERRLVYLAARPLPVVQWLRHRPDPGSVLRRRALPSRGLPRKALARLDALMRETLARSGGVGLAAPQVGVSRRVILVQLQQGDRRVLTCVDPHLRPLSPPTEEGYEACLSVEGVGGLVRRAARVEVSYFDLHGKAVRRVSMGWEARIFQHEVDHLDGILYLDRLIGPLLPLDEVRRRRPKTRASTWPGEGWVASHRGLGHPGRPSDEAYLEGGRGPQGGRDPRDDRGPRRGRGPEGLLL